MSTRTRFVLLSSIPQLVWLVLVAVAVIGSWTAQNGGQWAGSLLLKFATFLFAYFFSVPSSTTFGVPYVPISAMLLVVCAVSAVRIENWTAGFDTDAFSFEAVLTVCAVAATVASRQLAVRDSMTVQLHFPVADGRWEVAAGEGRLFNHHWEAPLQRAALDIVAVDRRGSSHRGVLAGCDEDYYAFGSPVHSPVDAEVIRCGDGLNDGELNPAKPAGNHVVLGAGSEEILIAHLKKGSVAVTAGQRVRAGQLLGVVGNSGNSTEPHLHIHAQRDGRAVRIVFDDVRGRMWPGRRVIRP
ncbi:M23 family metallopeptidase [Rhodococcus ruber]|uniref:M23 family metallopeptidase n=1 Tax=Rhodococcus ruber TaxID=1830 RepID=A0ABT4M7T8_9NOCA|nr:M23 family metallopeptidase [Rhodococcus ruber]MCZ4517018.1 M23 family metallopeptidase [Rhodococcus ruber]